MTEQQSELNRGYKDEGDGFDPVSFTREVFNSVKTNRSNVGPFPFQVVDTPSKSGKDRNAENMMNVFFRLIGFPAIRDETLITNDSVFDENCDKKRRDNALSQGGTINYFSSAALANEDNFKSLITRDSILDEARTSSQFNTMLMDPLPIDESIADVPRERRRPRIFPLLVDASIPVYPMERRVSPLFYDGDYILQGGRSRLKRPFLQHVIYMRTKVFSGFSSSVEDDIRTNITAEVGDDTLISASELSNYRLLELKIIQKLLQSLKKASKDYVKVRNEVKELRSKVTYVPAPVEEPQQRGGAAETADLSVEITTDLDQQLQAIDSELNKLDLFLLALPIEEVDRSDRIRRIEEEVVIRNTSPDAFIPEFNSLLTYERKPLERQKAKVLQERKKIVQKVEKAREQLQYYTGEFTGLSIFDVISVFYALFTVDRESLVALLNQSALERLANDAFFVAGEQATDTISSTSNIETLITNASLISPAEALASLEAQVREGFAIARTFQERVTRTNKTPAAPAKAPGGKA